MTERDEKEPLSVPLNENQKDAVIDDLQSQGATFFTWKQLQEMLKKFGPKTKVTDVQEAIKKKGQES